MITRTTFLLCLQAFSLFGQSAQREFQLIGLDDGIAYTIVFKEDLSNDFAVFSVGKNERAILGVRGLEVATIHLGKFLEAKFVVRGGSNVAVRELVLLCVFERKLFVCLRLATEVVSKIEMVYNSRADSLRLFDERGTYNISVELNESDKQFGLTLVEMRRLDSKHNPEQNEKVERSYELSFDAVGNFFYNSIRNFNRTFETYLSKDNTSSIVFVGNNIPCIQLRDTYYLLIDDMWCVSRDDKVLLCR